MDTTPQLADLLARYDAWRAHRDEAMNHEATHGRFPAGDLFASDDEGCALADELARWITEHTTTTPAA